MIHLSELSYEKVDIPSDVVSEGQEVEVKIIKIEEERKRLGLSLLLDKEVEEISIEDEKNSSDEHIEDSSEAEELESEDDVQKDENTEETEIVSMADTDQQNDEVVDSSAEEKAE